MPECLCYALTLAHKVVEVSDGLLQDLGEMNGGQPVVSSARALVMLGRRCLRSSCGSGREVDFDEESVNLINFSASAINVNPLGRQEVDVGGLVPRGAEGAELDQAFLSQCSDAVANRADADPDLCGKLALADPRIVLDQAQRHVLLHEGAAATHVLGSCSGVTYFGQGLRSIAPGQSYLLAGE